MVLNRDVRLFHLTLNFRNFSKQCKPWSDAAFCGVWSGSALFANVPNVQVQVLSTALWHHSDKNSVAINNRYLGFVKRGLITLVNDNHVDNFKDFFGVCILWIIVNNRPKNEFVIFVSIFCFHRISLPRIYFSSLQVVCGDRKMSPRTWFWIPLDFLVLWCQKVYLKQKKTTTVNAWYPNVFQPLAGRRGILCTIHYSSWADSEKMTLLVLFIWYCFAYRFFESVKKNF